MTGAADRLRSWVPRWWAGEGGSAGRAAHLALAPAEAMFEQVAAVRNLAYDRGWLRSESAPIPVVSVGNVGIGGAGKTPFAAWIAGRLLEWGERPAIVLRGYGRDEIAVHEELNPGVPVFADPRRVAAVRAASGRNCTVAVVDDGFQHRALRRDLDLVLVSVDGWSVRRHLLPRGPWREPVAALRRASIIVLTRKSASVGRADEVERALRAETGDLTIVRCRIEPTALRPLHGGGPSRELGTVGSEPVLAVATLADPRPFQAHLVEAGADAELAAFPDHHEFDAAGAARLLEMAAGRTIVVTRKEAVKLRTLLATDAPVLVLDQRVAMESGAETLDAALRGAVAR